MKILISILLFGICANAGADTIFLKDGAKIEGIVEGEMNGINLIRTKYGSLKINKKDIVSITKTEKQIKSNVAVTISTETAARHTFKTVSLSTSSAKKIYFKNDAIIASETFDSKDRLIKLDGQIEDATYTEYYPNGNIKTEKTIINGKENGTLKSYYPNGTLKSAAYYTAGKLNGTVKVFSEDEKILFEQNFKNSIPNGVFREYDESGDIKSELFYIDGNLAKKPEIKKKKKTEEPELEANLLITVKTRKLARGERFSFFKNDKYIGKLTLDKQYNILTVSGKVPDGAVQVYSDTGKLEKEFIFASKKPTLLKIYVLGNLKHQYTYKENQAVKK